MSSAAATATGAWIAAVLALARAATGGTPGGPTASSAPSARPVASSTRPVTTRCVPRPLGVAANALSPESEQVVTVDAPAASSTWATVVLWRRNGDCFVSAGGPWPARTGYAGLSAHRHEGDGTTPLGVYGIGPVMYGIGPDPGVAYRWHHLVCGDWWDEDPASARYNHFVHVRCGEEPTFGGDSEALWTEAPDYDALAVIEFNTSPVVTGRGSGIFLHEGLGAPTTGCVALAAPALIETLRWLRPGRHPVVVISVTADGAVRP